MRVKRFRVARRTRGFAKTVSSPVDWSSMTASCICDLQGADMTQAKDSVEQPSSGETLSADEVTANVRALVGNLLERGAEAPAITFALAYIATEFGLAVFKNSLRVFPMVLTAVSRAAADRREDACHGEINSNDEKSAKGATLH
jgi:hypothetical protein